MSVWSIVLILLGWVIVVLLAVILLAVVGGVVGLLVYAIRLMITTARTAPPVEGSTVILSSRGSSEAEAPTPTQERLRG